MIFNATTYLVILIAITTPLNLIIIANLIKYIQYLYMLTQDHNSSSDHSRDRNIYAYHKLWTQVLITADNYYTQSISRNNTINYEYEQQVHHIYKSQGLIKLAEKYDKRTLKTRDSRI